MSENETQDQEQIETFVGLDIDDVPELVVLPDDEYELRIKDIEIRKQKPDKGDGKFIMATLEVVGEPNAKDITHVMMLAHPDDDEKKANGRNRAIKTFVECFGIEHSPQGIEFKTAPGCTGWALLKTEESDDYGPQNKIRRFITPA